MSLTNVKTSLNKISKSLSDSHNSREYLIKNSREVIILCSQSIISAHMGNLKLSKQKAHKARKLLQILRKKTAGNLNRYLSVPEQELVEAVAFIAILENKQIPSVTDLKVSNESYVLGLLDCIGELKRLFYDKVRVGQSVDAEKIFKIMEDLYNCLFPFAMYDKIIKEARRKLDVNRILLEDARATLTEEIRRADLINAIKAAKKKK